jgi:serine/threonine protein kinase
MIHPQYLVENEKMMLHEVAQHLPNEDPNFVVRGVYPGGMGMCVRLQQVATGTEYAVKHVLPEFLGNSVAIERFADELKVWLSASACSLIAEAIAIVSINESPCVLAPWMKGGDLSDAIPGMSFQEKFETLVRVVRGLRWAKETLHIIHRDLKPGNVLLDEHRCAYVADWGLARPLSQTFARNYFPAPSGAIFRPNRTEPGSMVGSLPYAAPEQIRNLGAVDHRADIYALGCMMFEFETGRPPFLGKTREELIRQQLFAEPPNIGWSLSKKTMGLSKIVSRCLKKAPADRWQSYEELERVLLECAFKHSVDLGRCEVRMRYQRSVLGEGRQEQREAFENAKHQNSEFALVELDDVKKYAEEANNLISSRRYKEAAELLAPFHVSDWLDERDYWSPSHTSSLTYALCLIHLPGRLDEALNILGKLYENKDRPAEVFVNYGLSLLAAHRYGEAESVCDVGLSRFPDDPDIIGNHTIALRSLNRLDDAKSSALKRLRIRRDVHSLEEAINVLADLRNLSRNADLPYAINTALTEADLLYELRGINPNYKTIIAEEIQLHRFANNDGYAIKLCCELLEADGVAQVLREIGFRRFLEILARTKPYKAFFEKFDKSIVNSVRFGEELWNLYHETVALRFMIGRNDKHGAKVLVPETRDYLLRRNAEGYEQPILAARMLDWMDRNPEAIAVLNPILEKTPTDLEAVKAMTEILARGGHREASLAWAEQATKIAPWKAESFDLLSYVQGMSGRKDSVERTRAEGNRVFDEEMALFGKLRNHLDQLTGALFPK